MKVTVPFGVLLPGELTVAVNVTVCPSADGFKDELNTVVVAANWTVCASGADVLPKNPSTVHPAHPVGMRESHPPVNTAVMV
jgi:hypothetical protein